MCGKCSDIIRSSHLTLYPSMFSRIPGFRRILGTVAVSTAAAVALLACNNYNQTQYLRNTKVTMRVFVSNPVYPNQTGGGASALNIVDGKTGLVSSLVVSLSTLSGSISDAGMMSLSPNHDRTLIMSPSDSKLALVDNTRQSIQGTVTLPGPSESFFIASDNSSIFVAVPSAPVTGQAPGVVQKLGGPSVTNTATIPVPSAHYLVPSPSGNQILVFSDNVDTVVLLNPGLIGLAGQSTTISPCTTTAVPACTLPAAPGTFDRPVGAVFDASGMTAYILNCGQECGGTNAGVTAIDMSNTGNSANLVLASVPLKAATAALLQGTQLYVAGTQLGGGGFLSILNLAAGISSVDCAAPVNCQDFGITDGYHTTMQMGANGKLFVGSRACSGVCLSIFDTAKSAVVATPTNSPNGDVTGMAPIPNQNTVFVCQGTLLRIYDTTTDQLAVITPDGQPNIAGQVVDVKVIDF